MAARAGVRQSFLEPYSYVLDNTVATTNVANFCKLTGVSSLILASTSSIYGDSGEKVCAWVFNVWSCEIEVGFDKFNSWNS